jgi:hypothetical protein
MRRLPIPNQKGFFQFLRDRQIDCARSSEKLFGAFADGQDSRGPF